MKYKYYVGLSLYLLDKQVNKIAPNHVKDLLMEYYKELVNGNYKYDNKYSSDVRSIQERNINYLIGLMVETLTLHTLVYNKSFNGFTMSWEKFIKACNLIYYNIDINKKLRKVFKAKELHIISELMEFYSDIFGTSVPIIMNKYHVNLLIQLYLKTMKSYTKLRELGLELPPIEPPKIPDLMIVMNGNSNYSYLVPIEVLYTTNGVYRLRYDKRGVSKLDNLGDSLYLLYNVEPSYNDFKVNDELEDFETFFSNFRLYYYLIDSDKLRANLIRESYTVGDKVFDVYKHPKYKYFYFYKNCEDEGCRELIGKEFSALLKFILKNKISNLPEEVVEVLSIA